MIAVDTTIFVYANREESPRHAVALATIRRLAEGLEAWALPIFCVGEYLRVVTHERIFDPPTPIEDALSAIESVIQSPSVRLLTPGDRYLPLLRSTIERSGVAGNLVFDAQIAALCLEHGATTLLTEDRDFVRFPGLTVIGLDEYAA